MENVHIPQQPTSYYDELAERAVLGSIIENPDFIPTVMEMLNEQSFYQVGHREIYTAIVQVYDEKGTVDCLLINNKLIEKELINLVGGEYTVPNLMGTNTTTTPENVEFYAEIVKDKAFRRQMKHVGNQITELSDNLNVEGTDELSGNVETLISTLTEHHRQGIMTVEDIAREIIDEIKSRVSKKMEFSTGIMDLDILTAGLQMGELFIIAGRPSMGKCVSFDTLIMDAQTGHMKTIKEIYDEKKVSCATMNDDYKLDISEPLDYIDNGRKEVYRITTSSGRTIKATENHPFLTINGWKPLNCLEINERIATPRSMPYFGDTTMDENEVKILAYLIGDGGLTNRSPVFTNSNCRLVNDLADAIFNMPRKQLFLFGNDMRMTSQNKDCIAPSYNLVNKRSDINPVTELCKKHGIMGKFAIEKEIPNAIFSCPKQQIALFLNRLYACDGSAYIGKQYGIDYSTSSPVLAEQVHHLLLRFGIISRLRSRMMKYKNTYRPTYNVVITDSIGMITFANKVGIFGKESKLEEVAHLASQTKDGFTDDVIPVDIVMDIRKARDDSQTAWTDLGEFLGYARPKDASKLGSVKRKKNYSRKTLQLCDEFYNDDTLHKLAYSDIYWDRIKSIEYVGVEQVYDLEIHDNHNFVANDIIVHNSVVAAQIATYQACEKGNPVLFCSYEMSSKSIVIRMLAQSTGISFNKLSSEVLSSSEHGELELSLSELTGKPLYITDTQYNIQQLSAHVKYMKAQHDIIAVFVDYLTIIPADRRYSNQVEKITEYAIQLKKIASDNNISVVALSQLSRASERRQGGRPVLSDLRDSGAIEQSADVVLFIHRPDFYDENDNSNLVTLYLDKQRNGPRGEFPMRFNGERFRLEAATF